MKYELAKYAHAPITINNTQTLLNVKYRFKYLLFISQEIVGVLYLCLFYSLAILWFYAILWFCEWFIEAFWFCEWFIEEFYDSMPEMGSRCLGFSLSLKQWLLTRKKLLCGERTMLSNNTVLLFWVFFPRRRFRYGRAITRFFPFLWLGCQTGENTVFKHYQQIKAVQVVSLRCSFPSPTT